MTMKISKHASHQIGNRKLIDRIVKKLFLVGVLAAFSGTIANANSENCAKEVIGFFHLVPNVPKTLDVKGKCIFDVVQYGAREKQVSLIAHKYGSSTEIEVSPQVALDMPDATSLQYISKCKVVENKLYVRVHSVILLGAFKEYYDFTIEKDEDFNLVSVESEKTSNQLETPIRFECKK
jgi:hypothetical protein